MLSAIFVALFIVAVLAFNLKTLVCLNEGSASAAQVGSMAAATPAYNARQNIFDNISNPIPAGFAYKATTKTLIVGQENIIRFDDIFSSVGSGSFSITMVNVNYDETDPNHWCISYTDSPVSTGYLYAPAVWSGSIDALKGPEGSDAFTADYNFMQTGSGDAEEISYDNLSLSSEVFRITPSARWSGVWYFWIWAESAASGFPMRVAFKAQNPNQAPTATNLDRAIGYKGQVSPSNTVYLADVEALDTSGNGYELSFYNVSSSDNSVCMVTNNDGTLILTAVKHGVAEIVFKIKNSEEGFSGVSTEYKIAVTVAKAPLTIIAGLVYFGSVGAQQITVPISALAVDPDGEPMSISGRTYGNYGEDADYYTATISGTAILLDFIKETPKDFSKTNNLTVDILDSMGTSYNIPISVYSIGGELPFRQVLLYVEGGIAACVFLMMLIAAARRRVRGNKIRKNHSLPQAKNKDSYGLSLTKNKNSYGLSFSKNKDSIDIYLNGKSLIDYGINYELPEQQLLEEGSHHQSEEDFFQTIEQFPKIADDYTNDGLGNL
jgi:hypothetical protein